MEAKETLRDAVMAHLIHIKDTVRALGGTELTVHILKASNKDSRSFKGMYAEVDSDGTIQHDWIFTRLEQDLKKNPSEIWVIDFPKFGIITNNPENMSKHQWNDWWNRM